MRACVRACVGGVCVCVCVCGWVGGWGCLLASNQVHSAEQISTATVVFYSSFLSPTVLSISVVCAYVA